MEQKKVTTCGKIVSAFNVVLEMSTAGLPQDKEVKWTYLSQRQICEELSSKGHKISRYHVK